MKRFSAWVTYLQVAPLTLVFLLFLVVPIATIVVVSFFDYTTTEIIPAFILQNYDELLFSETTWRTYLQTVEFAAITWVLTLSIGFHARLLRGVPCALAHHADGAVPDLHHSLLDLQRHPHDLVDPVPGPQRPCQHDADEPRPDRSAAGIPALFQFLRRPRLRASLHAVHGGADLQLDDAHRPQPARSGARRRRLGLADAGQCHPAAVQARHRHRLDLRRHHRHGRFRHRAHDERRPSAPRSA